MRRSQLGDAAGGPEAYLAREKRATGSSTNSPRFWFSASPAGTGPPAKWQSRNDLRRGWFSRNNRGDMLKEGSNLASNRLGRINGAVGALQPVGEEPSTLSGAYLHSARTIAYAFDGSVSAEAEQCAEMARSTTDPQTRKAYEEQQKHWLEILAALERYEQSRACSTESHTVSGQPKDHG